jgi:hypothetical protein
VENIKVDESNKIAVIERLRDEYLSPRGSSENFDIIVKQLDDLKLQDILVVEDYNYLVYRYFETKYNDLLELKRIVERIDKSYDEKYAFALEQLKNKEITQNQFDNNMVLLKTEQHKDKQQWLKAIDYQKQEPFTITKKALRQIAVDFDKDRDSYEKLSTNHKNRSLLLSQVLDYIKAKYLHEDLKKVLAAKQGSKITLKEMFPYFELEIELKNAYETRLEDLKKIQQQLIYIKSTDAELIESISNSISSLESMLSLKTEEWNSTEEGLKAEILMYKLYREEDDNEAEKLVKELRADRAVAYNQIIGYLQTRSQEIKLLADYRERRGNELIIEQVEYEPKPLQSIPDNILTVGR